MSRAPSEKPTRQRHRFQRSGHQACAALIPGEQHAVRAALLDDEQVRQIIAVKEPLLPVFVLALELRVEIGGHGVTEQVRRQLGGIGNIEIALL